jgi:hypothetical protein
MKDSGFQTWGFLYTPDNCLKSEKHCDVHISLHGWQGGSVRWVEEDMQIIHYAASNDIIVLAPLATASWFTGQRKDDHPEWLKMHTKESI